MPLKKEVKLSNDIGQRVQFVIDEKVVRILVTDITTTPDGDQHQAEFEFLSADEVSEFVDYLEDAASTLWDTI